MNPLEDLKELWRRIVFNVAISNTDDHLRNHAFLLDENGWRLSPAYDMNPSVDKSGLALNIDLFRNSLDFELVRSIGSYFSLSNKDMKLIMEEVTEAVEGWKTEAVNLGIPRAQLSIMEPAFQTPLS